MREAAAAQAVALQDAKMEALVLSKKLRRLEAGGSHASLFEVYEEESRRRRRGGPTPRGASSPTTAVFGRSSRRARLSHLPTLGIRCW